MLRIILKILTFTFLFFVNPSVAQEIWRENFSIPDKGFWGNENGTTESDFSGVTSWTLDTAGIKLSNNRDYAKTVSTSGGRFECRDINGLVTWYSEKIDISEFQKVNIKLTAYETGSGKNENTKYLKAFYKIDNGSKLPFEKNGICKGNWGSKIAEHFELKGDTIQIICLMENHYSSDKVTLDEVTVWKEKEPSPPVFKNDVVINEILFNPFPGCEDYVEIYNASKKKICAGTLYLANRDKKGELNKIYPVTTKASILHPDSYLAITKNRNCLDSLYIIKCPACIIETDQMPSYNNDEGSVVLLNENMEVIDEFHYNEKMHSPFLRDEEGVSLERSSLEAPSNEPGTWHSASTSSFYGTPGYKNSQARDTNSAVPEISFEIREFSPNNDGYRDELKITYNVGKPGFISNINIFDVEGRFIMTLIKNEIVNTSGIISWNGENETGQLQPPGPYIIFFEFFNAEGEIFKFKNAAVLTGQIE